jgi:hypothetical protein
MLVKLKEERLLIILSLGSIMSIFLLFLMNVLVKHSLNICKVLSTNLIYNGLKFH